MSDRSRLDVLRGHALAIRRRFLQMHFNARAGHAGSGLSAIDVLTYLHAGWFAPADRFVLSKGHAASALYATLHHFGVLSDGDLDTYYKDGTLLPAHPAPRAFPAIPAATGSLGHGFSIGAGMAYTFKHVRRDPARVVCLLSDGECDEGAVWEAALFAAHHALDNLTVVVDANGLQGFGRTEDVLGLEPLVAKWQSFGLDVSEIDGHDIEQIDSAFARPLAGKPRCIIARTVKGKGVRFMENKLEWHYLPMSESQYAEALLDLERAEQGLDR